MHGIIEAQVHKVYSRYCEPAADTKKCHTKWMSSYEKAIRRRLQDNDFDFPDIDENGNINSKVSMPKEKFKNW